MRKLFSGLLIFIFLLVGCTGQLPKPEQAAMNRVQPVSAHDVSVNEQPHPVPAPLGQWRLPGAQSTVALSPDARLAVIANDMGNFYLLSMDARKLERLFSDPAYRAGTLAFIGNQRLGYFQENEKGYWLRVSDLNGQTIWQRQVQGKAELYTSTDGQRLLLVQRGNGTAWLFDGNGVLLAEFAIHNETKVFFNGHNLLLQNGRKIDYYDANGKVLFTYEIKTGPAAAHVLPDRSGTRIAIITREGDQTLYLFDRNGKLLWNAGLVAGENRPVFSKDGNQLFVIHHSRRVEVQKYDVVNAKSMWRTVLTLGEQLYDSGDITQIAELAPDVLRLNYRASNGDRYILDLGEAGRPIRSYRLRNQKPILGADQYVLTVAEGNTIHLYRIP
mgnify:CR=1 FL=1